MIVFRRVSWAFRFNQLVFKRYTPCFSNYAISNRLVARMDEMGVRKLTDIQEKALPVVLQGSNAIINAETGSGKTLCFLLPIINKLMNCNEVKAPFSFILVPTAELAIQIHSMFLKLSSEQHCSVVFSGNKLMMMSSTRCVIGIPSSLVSYDLKRIFKYTEILAIDEADILLTGGERAAAWKILKLFRASFQAKNSPLSCEKQMIFCGATLPSRGRKSALASMMRWVPKGTKLIQTSNVHLPPVNIEFKFVEVIDESNKLTELTTLLQDQCEKLSVLIFTNSVTSCEALYHSLYNLPINNSCIGRLDKAVGVEQRHLTMKMFLEGQINVLVCTDLFARGIDMPNVNLIVLYDFPTNSADFLHRIGRTARAGKSGKVVSFVLPSDKNLCTVIQHTISQDNTDFDQIFSRNKMLKRRIGKLLKRATDS